MTIYITTLLNFPKLQILGTFFLMNNFSYFIKEYSEFLLGYKCGFIKINKFKNHKKYLI